MQFVQERRLDVAPDAILVDVQPLEARGVEIAARCLVRLRVELLRPVEQLDVLADVARRTVEVNHRLCEVPLDSRLVDLDLAEPLLDLCRRQFAVGCQVEQALLLGAECRQLLAVAIVEFAGRALRVCDSGVHAFADVGDEVFREPDCRVVVGDGVFDIGGGQVRKVALPVLASATEEVAVPPTATVRFDVDHPDGSLLGGAPVTEQQPLEVVIEHAVPLAVGRPVIHDSLDRIEQILVDDRLVPSWVLLALVGDDADVVRVAQHAVQLGDRERLRLPPPGWPGLQAERLHLVVERRERVVAAGVQLERRTDERSARLIDRDGVDLASLVLDADVLVADASHAEGATVLGLVAHLDLDVLAGHPYLDLVDDVRDGLHRVGHDAFAEVLLGRDQLDAHAFELALGDDGVAEVAEGS